MINVMSVDKMFWKSPEASNVALRKLHELIEKHDGINYIVYGSIQALDQYIIEKIPDLKKAYPDKRITLTLYLNFRQAEDRLGLPDELVDDVKFYEVSLFWQALRKADVVFVFSYTEFYREASQVVSEHNVKNFHYTLVPVTSPEERKKLDHAIGLLPEYEKAYFHAICDPTSAPQFFKTFSGKGFKRDYYVDLSINYMLRLLNSGFMIYNIFEERDSDRVILLQSDEFCEKTLGSVLYDALENIFKENKKIDFIFTPGMSVMETEALKMISDLKQKYPECKVSILTVVDLGDFEIYEKNYRDEMSLKTFLTSKMISIPQEELSGVIFVQRDFIWYTFENEKRNQFDKAHVRDIEVLFKHSDRVLAYHYPYVLDEVFRIFKQRKPNSKSKDIAITHLSNPEVYDIIQNKIDQFSEKDRLVYTLYCEGMKVTEIGEKAGVDYHAVANLAKKLGNGLKEELKKEGVGLEKV